MSPHFSPICVGVRSFGVQSAAADRRFPPRELARGEFNREHNSQPAGWRQSSTSCRSSKLRIHGMFFFHAREVFEYTAKGFSVSYVVTPSRASVFSYHRGILPYCEWGGNPK